MKIIINFYLLILALAILIYKFTLLISQIFKINTKRFATNQNDYAISV